LAKLDLEVHVVLKLMRSTSNASSYGNPILLRRAFGDKAPAKRLYERVKCELDVVVALPDGKARVGEGRFLNLGVGGAYLNLRGTLEKGVVYRFFVGKGKPLVVDGKIARVHGFDKKNTTNYGVIFKLDEKQEVQLRLGLDELRKRPGKAQLPESKLKWFWWY
jgi:hypothetical protein